jgi:ATP-dependent helicase Lhr and Lhr-like helicase
MSLRFHSLVTSWFEQKYREPTYAQRLGWPSILTGRHTLIAAPTGSGKTLAAFLASIDSLVRQATEISLPDETQVLYISPLKALSNDIHRNLQVPLEEIAAKAEAAFCQLSPIRVAVRTGDTPARDRQAMLRRPPHILVTTPESFYLLLTGSKSREILRSVRTVIVDEIHALARDKRGSHLTLSLARLDQLCSSPPTRIGLSATQRPIEEIARFLVGSNNVDEHGTANCQIVDTGHVRELDLSIEVPLAELSAVCPSETWREIYARLSGLIREHRSTLVFVNTRRLAERVSHYLEEQLGPGQVASHHGSLSRETRLRSEEQLKSGQLKAIVATASLELGIDIGFIDLVCQLGSPRSIATLLQRVGRAGHALGRVPKGRLFPLTRDELLESLALVRAIRRGKLDQIVIPAAPLDILAQQIVAAVACDNWQEDQLFELCRRAWPYRNLQRHEFDAILTCLSEGMAPGNRAGAYLHRDRIHHKLRARRSARISAITSGGAIPEAADYRVVTEGERTFVGTLNEDFAIESQIGNVFQLGNASWRIVHVRGGEVTVRDAHGAPATVPFWLGEAPGRTAELSEEFSRLRTEIWQQSSQSLEQAVAWVESECSANRWAAEQAANYVAAEGAALGLVPSQQQVVFERFFDESGGMQLVVHAPFGARINRAWGLALRKCFCRTFDFELQASADDNGFVLSIGPNNSFPIERLFGLLGPDDAEAPLLQAVLAVPMFLIRWRWNVTRALAVLRQRGGKKVPPQLQRFRADDLLTAVFPMATACFEHRTGDLELPDHPLIRQTAHDCLHEAMDLTGWLAVLADIEAGRIQLIARDTREPSPFSVPLVNANVYAFLDDAPLEERRARAVASRRTIRGEDYRELGRLDLTAIAEVRAEAWPSIRDAEELHDTLLSIGALPTVEGATWAGYFDELVADRRAARCETAGGISLWIAAEGWPTLRAALPILAVVPPIKLPPALDADVPTDEARMTLVRGRLEISGPTTATSIAGELSMEPSWVQIALEQLELTGVVLRGQFTGQCNELEWCERRLLARIHRRTLDGLRRQVQPATADAYFRFLFAHHGMTSSHGISGRGDVKQAIARLEGFESPAGAWEQDMLPARVSDYDPSWLDELFTAGEVVWGRLKPPQMTDDGRGQVLTRITPISLMLRSDLPALLPLKREIAPGYARWDAQAAYEALTNHGALFFDDLLTATGLLPSQLEEALRELAALGLATSDGFAAIRALDAHNKRGRVRVSARSKKHRRRAAYSHSGRWSLFPPFPRLVDAAQRTERWAWLLLERYGVMFRDLLSRESLAPPWRDLANVYRRLEMRGEIRGGRFVAGVAGEQFALSDAVTKLRELRDKPPAKHWQLVSAADPLNLLGIVTSGPRVPSSKGNHIVFLDGRAVAAREAGRIRWLSESDEPIRAEANNFLARPAPHQKRTRIDGNAKVEPQELVATIGNPAGPTGNSEK